MPYPLSYKPSDVPAICRDYQNGIRGLTLQTKWQISRSTMGRILEASDITTSKRKYRYNERYFRAITSEARAYFLGYLTTDGYIVEGPKRYVVTLTSTDPEIPRAFAAALGNGIPVYEIPPRHQRRNSTEYRVSACSKLMAADLVALGVRQAKSLREVFCEDVPARLTRHYLRGLFDGDGTIGVYPNGDQRPQLRMGIVGSKQLLNRVAETLTERVRIPLLKARCRTEDNGLYCLQYSGNILARDICAWLYDRATIYLPRKRNIYLSVKGQHVREWINAPYGLRKHKTDS